MKVAILGARGIPAKYGGYDTFIEELVKCFNASSDIQFLVYCRSNYYEHKLNSFHSARLVYLPAPRIKAIESLLHSFLSSIHVLFQKTDLIYFIDPANAPFTLLLRLFGKRVIIHTDGIGWKRRKWGSLARRYYKFSEWLSSRTADVLITDNPEMQDYYRKEYDSDSTYISYGASNDAGINNNVYKEYGILEKNYLLVVARLEPENNTDLIIKEFTQSKISMPLVIVGDSPYNSPYMKRLQELSDDRVLFFGRIDDQAKLNALYKGAYLYIHGHEVGGTNPALLRAMNFGVASVVIDVPFNLSVVGESGFVFKYENKHLSSLLEHLVNNPMEVTHKGDKIKERAEMVFKWEFVAEEHKKLFYQMVK
jgi:glycosyltransferase involved in cell wall biosynthesis